MIVHEQFLSRRQSGLRDHFVDQVKFRFEEDATDLSRKKEHDYRGALLPNTARTRLSRLSFICNTAHLLIFHLKFRTKVSSHDSTILIRVHAIGRAIVVGIRRSNRYWSILDNFTVRDAISRQTKLEDKGLDGKFSISS